MNEAMVPPVPGKIPKKEPTPAPRPMVLTELLNSPLLKRNARMPMRPLEMMLPEPKRLALAITSAIPNKPMATAISAKPSWSSGIPKVKRATPVRSEERRVGKEYRYKDAQENNELSKRR